jgi:ATP-dependent Clp protease ATP-binding subunit ClpA
MIFMTSNLGAGEMSDLITGGRGFVAQEMTSIVDNKMDDKLTRTAIDAARRKFSPEFMNRIDKTVVFKMLRPEHLEQILEIELGMVQQRILQATGNSQFVFSCTPAVKKFLLLEGTDPKYGARHLKRSIEKNVVFPLANLVATGQIKLGDFIRIDRTAEGKMTFIKEAEGALVPVLLEKYGQEAAAASSGGKTRRSGRDSLLDKIS